MAGVSVAIPNFSGGMDEDINTFVRRFHGFLDSININVRENTQRVQATGLFRSALSGPAANLQARTMVQMNTSNSFRPHSSAHAFANHPGNNAITVGAVEARMVPRKAFAEDWTNSGGAPTDDAPRFTGASGAVPIILNGIQLGQAIYYFENFYPSVLEERRKVQFGTLDQGNDLVKTFYEKVKKYGKLLNFVKNLEKVEKRKSEMKIGLSKRTGDTDYKSQVHKPSSGFSPEDVDRMIKSITEKIMQNFQTQIQELQAKIPTVIKAPAKGMTILDNSEKQVQTNASIEKWNKFLNDHNLNDDLDEPYEPYDSNNFLPAGLPDTYRDKKGLNSYDKAEARLRQQKLDKEIAGIAGLFNNLNINDPDAMDTNLVREIATNDDEYTLQLELTGLGLTKKTTSKEIQKFSEAYSDDSMDIDLLRLDNKKDLASVEGVVEGKLKLPILIDSCCNKSVMPEEIYKELGLILDTNKICKLSGASTNTKSLGTVKNVKITLAPGCTITDDFAVIANYPYHELILNRPRLREYNYDLLESRKHMAITCNGKDLFIPIIPSKNEYKKVNSPVLEALYN
ncbi:959_t:CDS:2 [Entrophospora sp. SA101]|nr:7133_t:CDS:2 [Entrophospora sp. SA101]CAJ0832960.1 959_t:CDS:2 [Entrophospora sp. SA101]CAJ0844297.1 14616_t:CDS:2 [Entrophospora sp. SA101]